MQRISLVNIAHEFIKKRLHSGDIAIDATVGNGHDTLFLVEQVSASGLVFGFDIQQSAINATQQKLQSTEHYNCLTLIQANHADMATKLPLKHHKHINTIMFNLGYLPGGDKTVITSTDSTLAALSSALKLLAPKGIITVMAYPGHPGGDLEASSVKNWCDQLAPHCYKFQLINSSDTNLSAPKLFVIEKLTNFD